MTRMLMGMLGVALASGALVLGLQRADVADVAQLLAWGLSLVAVNAAWRRRGEPRALASVPGAEIALVMALVAAMAIRARKMIAFK